MLLNAAYLSQQQDWRLSLLGAVLCLLTAVTAFSLLGRAGDAGRRGRAGWVAAAAVVFAIGIWSAHLLIQLEFMAAWQLRHDLPQAALAMLLAIILAAIGLGLMRTAARDAAPTAGVPTPGISTHGIPAGRALAGGAILGGGLAALHYAGLVALQAPGSFRFGGLAVTAAMAVVVASGMAAAFFLMRRNDLLHRILAAIVMTVGLVGLQAITMATASLQFDHPMPLDATGASVGLVLSPLGMAGVLTVATFLFLLAGFVAALVDQRLVTVHRREAARLRQLADATFEGVVLHRDGWIVDANAAICNMLGRTARQIIGHHVLEVVAESGQTQVAASIEAVRSTEQQVQAPDATGEHTGSEHPAGEHPIEINLRHADGHLFPVEYLSRGLQGEAGLRVVAVRDISDRKAAEERIRFMANHDSLTGLPNRTLFQDRLTQAVARSKRGASTAAVLCLDLDRFKNVNDISGHDVGDELLRQVAQRLTRSVRADDTVARLSGDEFAIIQVGVAHPDGPAILADRLVKVLAQPFDIGGHQVMISTSLGIALYPGDGEDDEELLRAADTALYRAKAGGRGVYRFFEAEMDVRLQERRWLERELRQAVANQQLDLHYQPLVDCQSVKVLGFEALVRWNHAERGCIPPAHFIPLAEESGLILPLGRWVLRRACRDAMSWPADTIVAVNLSPAQFRQNDIVREVLSVLEETGLPPQRLELEITEGVLIDDTERVLATLSALKAAGLRLSLDDFGTGYSSLSYLQRFPFDKIKIDRSFISELEGSSDSMAIVRAVIALGRSLRITVTAEGVETPQQLALLRAEQCDQAQGFLIGHPQSNEEAIALLANPQRMTEKLPAAE
ncbi:MAG TPA: EAL domain-containing protein [Terriglobia bacterium]|nr:EAL domain-containing protein [Terriglobia bacterium]